MSWIDWCIVGIPLLFVLFVAFRAGKLMKGVVDFLAGGRMCGRYMLTASGDAQGMSVMSVVANVEMTYAVGCAIALWSHIYMPISMILGLTGVAYYRFRETRSLSLGQFLEMRYNKFICVYGASLRTLSTIIGDSVGPAVAARFFIYFLGLPHRITVFGLEFSTYQLILLIILALALSIIWCGGQLSVNVTDTLQAIICYPVLILFSIYFICHFDWGSQVAPVLAGRVAGESFVNPFDVKNMRDFNICAVVITAISMVLKRGNYMGGGIHGSARTPHEQKMSGILATWRCAVYGIFLFLISMLLITVMNSRDFAPQAKKIRTTLIARVAEEVLTDPGVRASVKTAAAETQIPLHPMDGSMKLSRKNNLDTPYLDNVHQTLLDAESKHLALDKKGTNAHAKFQEFSTRYYQSSLPVMLRDMLPVGMLGLFCVIFVMMMVSTDDSSILYSSMTLTQDVVLRFRKTPLTPKQHIMVLRLMAILTGGIFFLCANVLGQMDYIKLFIGIIAAIWGAAAGPVIMGGLYTRFGTSFGAFCSFFFGGGFAIGSVFVQRFWASHLYPLLDRYELTEPFGNFLTAVSEPLNPYVVWEMNPVKFPINSYELGFIAMIVSCAAYVLGSLATYRRPFNLDKMLHRGIYADADHKQAAPQKRSILSRFISITPEYTTGDKIIAWSAFFWSLVWGFGVTFIMVLVWNSFYRWPVKWWTNWVLITSLIVPFCLAVIVAFWFGIGGIRDLRRFFRDMRARGDLDASDNGMVKKEKES